MSREHTEQNHPSIQMNIRKLGSEVFDIASPIGSAEVEVADDRSWAEVSWLEVPDELQGEGRRNGAKLLTAVGQACVGLNISFLRGSTTLPAVLVQCKRVFGDKKLHFYDKLPVSLDAAPSNKDYDLALSWLAIGRTYYEESVASGAPQLEIERSEIYVHFGICLTDQEVSESIDLQAREYGIVLADHS